MMARIVAGYLEVKKEKEDKGDSSDSVIGGGGRKEIKSSKTFLLLENLYKYIMEGNFGYPSYAI